MKTFTVTISTVTEHELEVVAPDITTAKDYAIQDFNDDRDLAKLISEDIEVTDAHINSSFMAPGG